MLQEVNSLLDSAESIKEYVEINDHSDVMNKELKKIEMYCRKTYIMLKHFNILMEGEFTDSEVITKMTASLIRDQKYVKMRDNLGEYQI